MITRLETYKWAKANTLYKYTSLFLVTNSLFTFFTRHRRVDRGAHTGNKSGTSSTYKYKGNGRVTGILKQKKKEED